MASSSTPSLRTVLLACMLSCAPLLASAAAGEYAYFNDRDSGGGALYGGAPVWVKTPAQCAATCTADPNCFGWTLRIPSGGGDGPCYLKGTIMCDANSLSKAQPAGQYASGIVTNQCDVVCGKTVVRVPSGVCAIVTPTPTSTKAAGRYKRDVAQRNARAAKSRLCPKGQSACPIGSSIDGYECVDLSEELESCGACGNDCSALPGTRDVACNQGKCVVGSCAPGFSLSIAGTCKKSPKLAHRRNKSAAAQAHIRRYTI